MWYYTQECNTHYCSSCVVSGGSVSDFVQFLEFWYSGSMSRTSPQAKLIGETFPGSLKNGCEHIESEFILLRESIRRALIYILRFGDDASSSKLLRHEDHREIYGHVHLWFPAAIHLIPTSFLLILTMYELWKVNVLVIFPIKNATVVVWVHPLPVSGYLLKPDLLTSCDSLVIILSPMQNRS